MCVCVPHGSESALHLDHVMIYEYTDDIGPPIKCFTPCLDPVTTAVTMHDVVAATASVYYRICRRCSVTFQFKKQISVSRSLKRNQREHPLAYSALDKCDICCQKVEKKKKRF